MSRKVLFLGGPRDGQELPVETPLPPKLCVPIPLPPVDFGALMRDKPPLDFNFANAIYELGTFVEHGRYQHETTQRKAYRCVSGEATP